MSLLPRCVDLTLVLLLASACDAGITRGPAPLAGGGEEGGARPEAPSPGADPRAVFLGTVLPELLVECGSCHANDDQGVGFISGPDAYAQLVAWPRALVVPGNARASLLVTKGRHSGPALSNGTRRAVEAWIALEGASTDVLEPDAGAGDPTPSVDLRAAFTASPSEADALEVTFDASASLGTIVAYDWRYGDGEIGSGPVVTHRFPRADTFAVVLTVADDTGATATTTQVLEVGTGLPQVIRMVLVDADTETDIPEHSPLVNGSVVDLALLGTTNLSIRAETAPEAVGSVRFTLDAELDFHTENNPPYAIAGDSGGDYVAWTPSPGERVVTAMPFSESNGAGAPGRPLTVRFTVR